MEEEPEKRRADPPFLHHGLLHHLPHGALQAGAGGGVEGRRELRVGDEGEERDGELEVHQLRFSHGDRVCCEIFLASSVGLGSPPHPGFLFIALRQNFQGW